MSRGKVKPGSTGLIEGLVHAVFPCLEGLLGGHFVSFRPHMGAEKHFCIGLIAFNGEIEYNRESWSAEEAGK